MQRISSIALSALVFGLAHCGGDDPPPGGAGNEAQQRGVGDACGTDTDCVEAGQSCLANFKGGYCGVRNCNGNADCPDGSACVAHTDGVNYCFLLCAEKYQCNYYRPASDESNCSANITFVDNNKGAKACVPPS